MLLEPRLDGLGERDDGIEVFVVRLGLGNAGHEQGLVVLSRPRDGGDGVMHGEEVATPADRERALGAALANADDAGAVSQMRRVSWFAPQEERGGVAARECQRGRRLRFIGSQPICRPRSAPPASVNRVGEGASLREGVAHGRAAEGL